MNQHFTNMRDLVNGFANAMNLISPETQNHHQQVAYLSYHIAKELGFDSKDRHKVIYAAMLHDVGAVLLPKVGSLKELERQAGELSETSANFLNGLPRTREIAEILRNSQISFKNIADDILPPPKAILFGQIIKLADTVSLLLNSEKSVLNQVEYVCRCVRNTAERKELHYKVTEAFLRAAKKEYLWMNLLYQPNAYLNHIEDTQTISLDVTVELTKLMSHIIDFRSPFTAMHSAGVAASAVELSRLLGMSDEECKAMQIAGYLHDIGKLRIPKEILEKPGKLTDEEFNIIKEHAYYTYILLKDIKGFEQITVWAAYHHEKLNGNGYPFRRKAEEIPLGARIMAVADVFSAITEERPYRKGMDKEKAISVLRENVQYGNLSEQLVEFLILHYDSIDEARDTEARIAGKRYFDSHKQETERSAAE